MLDRLKLLKELQTITESIFFDVSHELVIAQASWQRIIDDSLFIYKVRQISTPLLVPEWSEAIGTALIIEQAPEQYTALSVDGSQIYPDRHQGTACYLINIGGAQISYARQSQVTFYNKPYIFTGHEYEQMKMQSTAELVNAQRSVLELQEGLILSQAISKQQNTPFIFLFDGNLIFWHTESLEQLHTNHFFNTYIQQLLEWYTHKIVCAGYISMPRSKELVNLIRLELCGFQMEGCTFLHAVDHIVDSTIIECFIPSGHRSIVFKSRAPVTALYPESIAPHFFYINTGCEVARIEIPAWVACDTLLVNQISALVLDQIKKGRGYPVVLAEAHEQAVVKGPDREFFYHVLTKASVEQRKRLVTSQKSIKKRGMGI